MLRDAYYNDRKAKIAGNDENTENNENTQFIRDEASCEGLCVNN